MNLVTGYKLNIEKYTADMDLYPQRHLYSIVEARYIKRGGITDNPDICALPKPATRRQILEEATIPIVGYDYDEVCEMPAYERKESILLLQKAFAPLSVTLDMSKAVDDALFSSYMAREGRSVQYKGPADLVQAGIPANVYSVRHGLAGRPQSFVIYGVSGCGKTVAMNLVKNMYPQAIHHVLNDFEYIQIPIITVTALVGNMSELMIAIARAIDDILGNGPVWEKRVRNRNVGLSGSIIKDAIRLHHVGLIIIDESQFLKFDTSNASLENLIGISEETGCALGFVGNRDLIGKMDKYPRFVGRTMLNRIEVRCVEDVDRLFFVKAIEHLWQYQWTKKRTPLTQEILDELLRDSMYNIAILKTLLMQIQSAAVTRYPAGGITAEYIHDISEKKFSVIRTLILDGAEASEHQFLSLLQNNVDSISADARKLAAKASQKLLEEQDAMHKTWGPTKYSDVEAALQYFGITKSQTRRVINQLLSQDPDLPARDIPFIVDAVKRFIDDHRDDDTMKNTVARKRKKELDAAGEELVQQVVKEQIAGMGA